MPSRSFSGAAIAAAKLPKRAMSSLAMALVSRRGSVRNSTISSSS
jgi:hypothetical protein